MESTGFDADIFIDAVKKRPIIWNSSSPEYLDKTKKRNAWIEVCSLMCDGFEDKSEQEQNEFGTKLMKKWKGMRDTFLKSVKKKTVPGQGANRPYIYSRQMQFVLDCGISSALATSIDNKTETPIDEDGVDRVEETIVDVGVPTDRSDTQSPTFDTTAKDWSTKRTRNADNCARIPAKKRRRIVEEHLLKFMNTLEQVPVREQPDDDRSFFDSLLPIVKTLPMDTKLEFRYRVMGLLKEMRASVTSHSY